MSEVLFEQPFDSGNRKMCANCGLFVLARPGPGPRSVTTCAIHGELPVSADAICGYHVPGRPMEPEALRELDIVPVKPIFSGLERVPGGTSCDICRYYRPVDKQNGICIAIAGKPMVAGRACCSRWTRIVP